MGNYLDFITTVHTATKRNYLQRVVEADKATCAEVALRYDRDYWDGDRKYGYGGFRYDGRWRSVAEKMVKHYGLKPGARILDVGCGKAFLLYEFTQILDSAEVFGVDISEYGLANAKEEVRPHLRLANSNALPFGDGEFDLVVSLNTFHNLYNYDLHKSLQEIERVGRGNKYIVVESYRTEQEKVNLLYWQLTCRTFHTPAEWEWVYERAGYTGDYGFIFFE